MPLVITKQLHGKDAAERAPLATNPFELRAGYSDVPGDTVHIIRQGVRCCTDTRGHATPRGLSPLEIALDASDGFIPLWAPDVTLHWRFRESSLEPFQQPEAVKAAIEALLGEAILTWEDAIPIKFAQRSEGWDFEIVMRQADDCDISGCVLASAFFPDAGQHELVVYPKMFEQDRQEQIETMAHEIGHVFGLRHFFALVKETAWPAVVFGEHSKFSIMNYGADSRMTDNDRADLRTLYQLARAGELTHINGTPIRLVQPFHSSGTAAGSAVTVAVPG